MPYATNTTPPYRIDQTLCTFCAGCASVCPAMAIQVHDAAALITAKCTGCAACYRFCPVSAVTSVKEHRRAEL